MVTGAALTMDISMAWIQDIKTVVLRKTESGQAFETRGSVASLDSSFTIEYKMFTTSTPGLIFILVKNNSGYFLLKSQ